MQASVGVEGCVEGPTSRDQQGPVGISRDQQVSLSAYLRLQKSRVRVSAD